jgi:hypothetical protein
MTNSDIKWYQTKEAKILGFALLLYIIGFYLISWVSWKIGLGVFLVLWANNIGTRKN